MSRENKMVDAVASIQVGKKFCEALGMNPNGIRSLTICLEVDRAVTVTVERYVTQEESERLIVLLEDQYELAYKSTEVIDEFGKGVHDRTDFESKDWREYARGVED